MLAEATAERRESGGKDTLSVYGIALPAAARLAEGLGALARRPIRCFTQPIPSTDGPGQLVPVTTTLEQ